MSGTGQVLPSALAMLPRSSTSSSSFSSSSTSSATAIVGTTDGTVAAVQLSESVSVAVARGTDSGVSFSSLPSFDGTSPSLSADAAPGAAIQCVAVAPPSRSSSAQTELIFAGTGDGDIFVAMLAPEASGGAESRLQIARLDIPGGALRGRGGESAFSVFPIAALAPLWAPPDGSGGNTCLVLAASTSGESRGE